MPSYPAAMRVFLLLVPLALSACTTLAGGGGPVDAQAAREAACARAADQAWASGNDGRTLLGQPADLPGPDLTQPTRSAFYEWADRDAQWQARYYTCLKQDAPTS
ncbi:hypothetical protein [Zavarzinia sp. CC-PAN008]|uniref:hypothetical protein n=1 Tax=Zavarzinia sp. CC-PAN008 TaxID=3243332 RepID=UPI003F7430F8